jgi:hypothetical protein
MPMFDAGQHPRANEDGFLDNPALSLQSNMDGSWRLSVDRRASITSKLGLSLPRVSSDMALSLTAITSEPLCEGHEWEVTDVDALAEYVARIAVGQCTHIAKILLNENATSTSVFAAAKQDAKKLLILEDGKDPWHRDGWIFQAISWIAAYKAGGVVIRKPHMIMAHKGFDGLKLEVDDSGNVIAVVIFEDKATENPRDTIRDEVWPGIEQLEGGARTNDLCAEIAALLESQARRFPDLDVDAAIERIAWQKARSYRVAITVPKPHTSDKARGKLFKGYDLYAPGPRTKRGAETMHLPALRTWMQGFAERVIGRIEAMTESV